jgi:hypothetical protein
MHQRQACRRNTVQPAHQRFPQPVRSSPKLACGGALAILADGLCWVWVCLHCGLGFFSWAPVALRIPVFGPFPLVPAVFVSQDCLYLSCLRLSRLPISESLRVAVLPSFPCSWRPCGVWLLGARWRGFALGWAQVALGVVPGRGF